MTDRSPIEWTDATWNPIRGCSRVSAGCMNCYAERVAARFSGPGQPYEGLVTRTTQGPKWTGEIRFSPNTLYDPIAWKKPRRIFVNSMSDLFHDNVQDRWIADIFNVMACAPQHTFQILTKRPERMRDVITIMDRNSHDVGKGGFLKEWPHVWLGVSVENQFTADERIPLLLHTPAAVRWISAEPLLGPLDLRLHIYSETTGNFRAHRGRLQMEIRRPADGGLHWIVAGGESGPGARPMHPDWARTLRDQCRKAGVPFFFKQWGEWAPDECQGPDIWQHLKKPRARWTGDRFECEGPGNWSDDENLLYRLGKKISGRRLDGRTHDEYPA